MSIVNKTGVFGHYGVDPLISEEFDGRTITDLVTELSALSVIKWDEEKVTMILEPRRPEHEYRLKNMVSLLFNLLGLADSQEIVDTDPRHGRRFVGVRIDDV